MKELLMLGGICIGSAMAHEYGHAIPAKILGWKLVGWKRVSWYAFGYVFEVPKNPRGFRIMALGGILSSAYLAAFGFSIGGNYGTVICGLNLSILVFSFPMDIWCLVKGSNKYELRCD